MRWLFSLCLFFAFCAPMVAQAESCGSQPVRVSASIIQDSVRGDNSLSLAQLQQLPDTEVSAALGGRQHVRLGATHVQFGYETSPQVRIKQTSDGVYCAEMVNLDVRFRFSDTVVYIAREIPRSSCLYGEVQAHENRHVAVDSGLVAEWNYRVQEEVRAIAARIRPIQAYSTSGIAQQMTDQIQPQLNQLMQRIMQERDRRQAQIDTLQEYQRVSRVCNGEAARYVQ